MQYFPLQNFLGIPLDFLIVIVVALLAFTYIFYKMMFSGTPVKALYLRRNYTSREYNAKENINSTYIKVVGKKNKILKTLKVKGKPFEHSSGGLFRKRIFLFVEGINDTINPVDDDKYKSDPKAVYSTIALDQAELFGEVTGKFISNMNKVGGKMQFITMLLSMGCGAGVVLVLMIFFGFIGG